MGDSSRGEETLHNVGIERARACLRGGRSSVLGGSVAGAPVAAGTSRRETHTRSGGSGSSWLWEVTAAGALGCLQVKEKKILAYTCKLLFREEVAVQPRGQKCTRPVVCVYFVFLDRL